MTSLHKYKPIPFTSCLKLHDHVEPNRIFWPFSANFGIFCSTPGIAVGRAVPRKVAARMLFTGLPLTAHEALEAGLVSKVVTQESLGMQT